MDHILKKINVDFANDENQEIIWAKQGDQETRFVEITPLDNGQRYQLGDGITARFQATKPDGTTVLNDCTIEGGKVIVELTYQTLALAGAVGAEIGLYKDTELLSSQIFFINVKERAYDLDAVESSDEFNALTEALAKVEHFYYECPKDILNKVVEVADWEASTRIPGFPYQAFIAIEECRLIDIPEVLPSMAAIEEGLLCPYAEAVEGGVYLFAMELPEIDYDIRRITLREENVV